MPITSKDIARIAGVSQSTVSRSLNDSPLISRSTKERIRAIAEEQGFEFNANAQSLITSRTGTIGIIYPENYRLLDVNVYFSSLHTQIRDILERENLDLIVSFSTNKFSRTSNIRRLLTQRKVDGLIIVRSQLDTDSMKSLKSTDTPYLFLHHFLSHPDFQDVDRVYTDHHQGGFLASRHLLNLGHRNILHITNNRIEDNEFTKRLEGCRAAYAAFNLPFPESRIYTGEGTIESGERIVKEQQALLKETTAVFAHNDMMALGVIEACRALEIRIPEDIALVGYDDIEMASCFHPYLTTIHQPREKIAMLACHRLIDMINAKKRLKSRDIMVQPKLTIRESCGAMH